MTEVTVERIERAKRTVARMMFKHDMPHLIDTIEYLDGELKKLRRETAAMEYAREILLENGRNKGSNTADASSS